MVSLPAVLCRRIKACEFDAMAMARWGYSRIRIWLDFSGDGGWPGHKADDGDGAGAVKLYSMSRCRI
jgi:hypothetical protein